MKHGDYLRLFAIAALIDSHTLQLEIIAPQELSPRAQFYGGYALASDNCPSGTDKCGDSVNINGCCPSGRSCLTFAFEAYCCPDSNDCRQQIDALPICADPSWVLYSESDISRWCCRPGQIGVSSMVCASTGLNIPATMLASTLSQIGTVTQASGTAMMTASPASNTIFTAASSTATYGSSGSSTNVSQNSSSPVNLSAAAIAGIGAAAGVVLLTFLGWFCYCFGQRRALRKQSVRLTSENPPVYVSDAASTKHHLMAVPPPQSEHPHFDYQYTPEIDSYPTGRNPAELAVLNPKR